MLVNTAEVMMSSDYFEQLLMNNTSQSQSQENIPRQPHCIDRTSRRTIGSKVGCPSLMTKFPNIIEFAAVFFKQYGFYAHSCQ